MLYRIQSLALSFVVVFMCVVFISFVKDIQLSKGEGLILSDLSFSVLMRQFLAPVFFCILSCSIIILALYTIFKYDNRILQLKLMGVLAVILAVLIIFVGIHRLKMHNIAVFALFKELFWLFGAFFANVFTGFRVYQDHCLVQDDSLR